MMEVRRLLVRPATEADLQQSPMSVPKPWLGEQSTKPGPLTRREIWGSVLWGLLSLVVLFFELTAAFDDKSTPWPTLSRTAGTLQEDIPLTALPILGGLAVLAARIVFYPWPSRKSES
jgi:hypothetical protein